MKVSTTKVSASSPSSYSSIERAIKSYNATANNDNGSSGKGEEQQLHVWNTKPNYDETRHFFGKSFAGTTEVPGEPVCDWMVNQLFEDEATAWYTKEKHREAFSFFMSFPLYESFHLHQPLIVQKKDTKTDDIISTAVILEYDRQRETSRLYKIRKGWNTFRAAVNLVAYKEGLPELLKSNHKDDGKRVGKKAEAAIGAFKKYHKNHGPTGKHWYIYMVGVNPDYNGQGYGGELMRKVGSLADEVGMMCYLECGARNQPFYEKMGYEVVAKHVISDPDDTSGMPLEAYVMIRHPK